MGRRWRIRHKLTLGLVLVAGIMLLLLAGTVDGLLSYRDSMNAIHSKHAELGHVEQMYASVGKLNNLARSGPLNLDDLREQIKEIRRNLLNYENALKHTVSKNWDPDNGQAESSHVEAIGKKLDELNGVAAQDAKVELTSSPEETSTATKMARIIQDLADETHGLTGVIFKDLEQLRTDAKSAEVTTMAIIIGTTALGFVLMIILARYAYRWLVNPIRELHDKVGHLAQGNFDTRIVVQSGDEIQDLAEAFNNMTDRLRSIYRDLEHQVNERSRQLVRSESLAGVGFLAAGVAHEINNPLASIAFCGEALERRLRELLAGKRDHPDMITVNNYLRMIQDEAFRCKDITQKLLEFSRIGERQRQMTDLAQIIQSVIDMVHLHQAYKGKNIVFDPIRNPTLLINDQEIKSVVLNLVANALDSMDEGGTLTITLDAASGMAVMTFTDNGCGMAPEVLENLFEPFFSRSRTGKGIGLGLSISHRIITQHGGEIEATSPGANQGSTFTVRLPLTPKMAAEQPAMAMAA